jgi:serine/threonine protein kinase
MTRYFEEQLLAVGGMGEIFVARQEGAGGTSRSVALKRIAPSLSHDPEYAALFVAEARIASRLSHPNIVTIYDFDRDDQGNLFMAMELVRGIDLHDLLCRLRKRGQRLDAGTATYIAEQLLKGLDYLQSFQIGGLSLALVHRDVSPHNVFLSSEGDVKLGDFGIVKATAVATHTQSVRGKLPYMSPEQALGLRVDGRSDLFSVGVLLFEMLSGERLFDGLEADILGQVTVRRPVSLRSFDIAVSARLAALVERLLHKNPRRRFANATDALRALERVPEHSSDGPRRLVIAIAMAVDDRATQTDPRALPVSTSQARTHTVLRPHRRTRWRSLVPLAAAALLATTWAVGQSRGTESVQGPKVMRDSFVPLRQADFSRPFDVLANVDLTARIARRVRPDAVLYGLFAYDVDADGFARAEENPVLYAFRSPTSPSGAFLSGITVAISSKSIALSTYGEAESGFGAIGRIRCSIPQLWDRAHLDPHQHAYVRLCSMATGPPQWLIIAGATVSVVSDDCP